MMKSEEKYDEKWGKLWDKMRKKYEEKWGKLRDKMRKKNWGKVRNVMKINEDSSKKTEAKFEDKLGKLWWLKRKVMR